MKLYVGTMNDGLFLIDQPPRPSHDSAADVPAVKVIAKMADNTPEAQRIAQALCDAYNDAFWDAPAPPGVDPFTTPLDDPRIQKMIDETASVWER